MVTLFLLFLQGSLFLVQLEAAGPARRCDVTPASRACDPFEYKKTFYYNPVSGLCEKFPPGQCADNVNGFRKIQRCNCVCAGFFECKNLRPDFCQLDPDPGKGAGDITMYYYNKATGACEPFQYKGCGGNLNKFVDRENCECKCVDPALLQCGSLTRGKRDLCYECPNDGINERRPRRKCSKNKPGNNVQEKTNFYYYDAASDSCKTATYEGCGGRKTKRNHFESDFECQCICGSLCAPP